MNKKPTVYFIILGVWSVCALLLLGACGVIVYRFISGSALNAKTVAVGVFLMLNAVMLAYMWLGSVKDFMFSFLFLCRKKRIMSRYDKVKNYTLDLTNPPKVLLLYCTCNDFNADALKESMAQDYPNFETVILDDSSKISD